MDIPNQYILHLLVPLAAIEADELDEFKTVHAESSIQQAVVHHCRRLPECTTL